MKSTTLTAALFAVMMAANAETIVDTFESDDTVEWVGGTLSTTTETPTAPANYGYPVTNATHSQTLSISGTATRTTSGNNVFDMMVKLNNTDDELREPGDSALFAVAVDKSGNLKLYCKPTSDGTPSWSSLGQYNSGDWARLTFDVKNDTAGSFVVATNGVLTGVTYYLAAEPSPNIVTNVAVIGTTAIDDFVAKSGSFEPYAQVNSNGSEAVTDGVPAQYFALAALAGCDKTDDKIPSSSPEMTVAQAYVAGVLPEEGATFDIQDATFDGSELKLTFPGDWPAGTYTIKYGTTAAECNKPVEVTSAVKSNGRNQVTVNIPENFGDGSVLYYTVSRGSGE